MPEEESEHFHFLFLLSSPETETDRETNDRTDTIGDNVAQVTVHRNVNGTDVITALSNKEDNSANGIGILGENPEKEE